MTGAKTYQQPAVTVLMPAWNAEMHIASAIESVLNQTFTNFELVIVNDGSTDRTAEIIQTFNDERIFLFTQENKGISAALNYGLSVARAPLIARFDADDRCYPNRLQRQYDFLSANPDYIIVGGAADYCDEKGEFIFTYRPAITNEEIQTDVIKICPFIHSGVLFRRDAMLQAGGYSIHAHTFEDHLLWINALKLGKGANLEESLLQVTLHAASITIDERWRTSQFLRIKRQALERGTIDKKDGDQLKSAIQSQNSRKIKEGAYYALLSKKYLWNNYQPAIARKNIIKTIALNPFSMQSYLLWMLSYFPSNWIQRIYKSRS